MVLARRASSVFDVVVLITNYAAACSAVPCRAPVVSGVVVVVVVALPQKHSGAGRRVRQFVSRWDSRDVARNRGDNCRPEPQPPPPQVIYPGRSLSRSAGDDQTDGRTKTEPGSRRPILSCLGNSLSRGPDGPAPRGETRRAMQGARSPADGRYVMGERSIPSRPRTSQDWTAGGHGTQFGLSPLRAQSVWGNRYATLATSYKLRVRMPPRVVTTARRNGLETRDITTNIDCRGRQLRDSLHTTLPRGRILLPKPSYFPRATASDTNMRAEGVIERSRAMWYERTYSKS